MLSDMTRLVGCCIAMGASLLVAGCVTIARDVQMYPDNEAAHALGPLHGKIVGHGNLNGTATMSLPGGELLQGRYSISHGGGTGVGSTYASVYGPGGFAAGSAVSTSTFVSGSGNGEADMMSPQGTTAHCEFINDNFNGHGHGACRLSGGELYRMQY
jgi:hypothetical protein